MINPHIVRRWAHIVCLSSWAVPFLFLLILAADKLGNVGGYFAKMPSWFVSVSTVLIFAIILVPLLRVTPTSWQQFRFFHRYPPAWIAGVLGVVWIWFFNLKLGVGPAFLLTASKWGAFVAIAALMLALLYVRWLSDSPGAKPAKLSTRASAARFTDITEDWRTFEEWVSSDDAITQSEQDLFGMRDVAGRMAREFREHGFEGRGFSMGLIGPFGSGKTSIINLIKLELADAKDPHVWVCETNCWGFENSTAALHHVLSEIVKTIGEYVDCSGLRGMPEAYRQALSTGNNTWRLLGGLLGAERDPARQLKRLTPILMAANARLLVVLEDLDRNQSPSFNPDDIIGMLYRLKSVEGVSLVLAASSQSRVRMDFAKLCDHIEIVPGMEQEAVLRAFGVIRERCLEGYSFIDPADPVARNNSTAELWSTQPQL